MKAIQLPLLHGDGHIDAYPTTVPGLVVAAASSCREKATCFTVVHARSGRVVLPRLWFSPEGALGFAERVSGYADWQRDRGALMTSLAGLDPVFAEHADDLGSHRHAMKAAATPPTGATARTAEQIISRTDDQPGGSK